MKRYSLLILICVIMLITGCSKTISNFGDVVFNLEQFERAMTGKEYKFEIIDVSQDFLSTERKRMVIGDNAIDIYLFDSNEKMEIEAGHIDSGGCSYDNGTKSVKVSWTSFPHFYKKGNIIVQYIGEDEKIISDLKDVLGGQFAGYDVRDNVPLGVNPNLSEEQVEGVIEYWKYSDDWAIIMPSNEWKIGIGPSYEFDKEIPYKFIDKNRVQAEDMAALTFSSVEYWYYDGLSMVLLTGFRGDGLNEPKFGVIQYISTIQQDIKTSRGIAIGDSVSKLKEVYPEIERNEGYWSEDNSDRSIPNNDSCYIYTVKESNRSIMFLTKDNIIVQIDIGDGLDGQYWHPASPGFKY